MQPLEVIARKRDGGEHSAEEIEDYAMRMAWAGIPEEGRMALLQMAATALVVHDQNTHRR